MTSCTSDYSPTFLAQNPDISGDKYGWYNCAAYVGAMGADYATCRATLATGATVRALTNEPKPDPKSPGLTTTQIQEALEDLGVSVGTFTRLAWPSVEALIDSGRFVSLAVQYSSIRTTKFSGDPNFYGGHAIGVPPGWEVLDPLCDGRRSGIYRYQHEQYPRDLLKRAAGAFKVRYSNGTVAALGFGYAQGWYTKAHSATAAPQPQESDVKVTAVVKQQWTANGLNGVLRATPDRSAPITVRLPAGTPVTTEAEAVTPDGNHWRLLRWPKDTRTPAWLIRYGPGVPPDHDFIAGPVIEP